MSNHQFANNSFDRKISDAAQALCDDIKGMIDGNGANADDVEIIPREATYRLHINLNVAPAVITQDQRSDDYDGKIFNSRPEAVAQQADAESKALQDEATHQAIKSHIENLSLEARSACDDYTTLGDLSASVGYKKPCSACSGRSNFPCDDCNGVGRSSCPSCAGTRLAPCTACDGIGAAALEADAESGDDADIDAKPCPKCGGAGRDPNQSCADCAGDGLQTCAACTGTGLRDCESCDGVGHHIYTLQSQILVEFDWAVADEDNQKVPAELFSLVRRAPGHGLNGDFGAPVETRHTRHGLVHTLSHVLDIHYTFAPVRCGDIRVDLHALGKDRTLPSSDLLDRFLEPTARRVRSRRSGAAFAAAKETRIGRDVIDAVGDQATGRIAEIEDAYRGQVSKMLLEDLFNALTKHFNWRGRTSLLMSWTMGILLAAAAGFAVPYIDVGAFADDPAAARLARIAGDLGIPLLIILIAIAVSPGIARRRLRKLSGILMPQTPKFGRTSAMIVVSCAMLLAGAATWRSTGGLGMPRDNVLSVKEIADDIRDRWILPPYTAAID